MGRPVDRGPERLDYVGADEIGIAERIRTGQLVQSRISPVQQDGIHAEGIRNKLLRIQKTEKHGLFIAHLIIDSAHILAALLISCESVNGVAARGLGNTVLFSRLVE